MRQTAFKSITSGRALRTWVHVLILIALPAIVFSNTLQNDYHLDSVYRVKLNTEINNFWPPWRFFTDIRTGSTIPQIAEYRPIMPLVHAIDVAVSKFAGIDRLAGFHIGNIVVHIGTSILVYLLFCELLGSWSGLDLSRKQIMDRACAAALLFAIHPISGVPVNYIAGRDLLLMMFFLTAAFLVYVRMRRLGDTVGCWFLALVLTSLAILSKQVAITAFGVVFLFEVVLAKAWPTDWRAWARIVAFGVPTAAYFMLLRFWIAAGTAGGASDMGLRTPVNFTYPLTMLKAHLFYYLRNFVWPFEMRPLGRIEMAESIFEPQVLIGAAFILATLAVAAFLWKRSPLISFSILAYWLLLALTSSIFSFAYAVTDYRQYPSLAFLCLAITVAWFSIARFRGAVGAVIAIAIYFGASSFHMNTIWKTEESFWGQSVRYGGTDLAHVNFGLSVARKDPKLAEHHYREALRLYPKSIYGNINLGLFLINQKREREGLALLRKAVDLRPEWALTHYWLSRGLRDLGQRKESLIELRRAADLDPRRLDYQYQAASVLQRSRDYAASIGYLNRVLAFNRRYRHANFMLASALQKTGHLNQAITEYRRFLSDRPNHVQGRFNLAYTLMQQGECGEAVKHFERVLVLRKSYAAAHFHLAACYRALGDAKKAESHMRSLQQLQ